MISTLPANATHSELDLSGFRSMSTVVFQLTLEKRNGKFLIISIIESSSLLGIVSLLRYSMDHEKYTNIQDLSSKSIIL